MLNKKIVALATTAALAACLALTACGGGQAASSSAAAEPSAPSSEAASASAEAAPAEAASSASAEAAAAAPAASASPADSYIGEEAAIEAAFAHAGIAQADATEIEAELDLDDAVVHYDVDFKSGGLEYSYDIDAATGDVLSYESEVDD